MNPERRTFKPRGTFQVTVDPPRFTGPGISSKFPRMCLRCKKRRVLYNGLACRDCLGK